MRELEDEVDSLRRERDRRERDKVADEEELQILRDRCERLEEERERGGGGRGGVRLKHTSPPHVVLTVCRLTQRSSTNCAQIWRA